MRIVPTLAAAAALALIACHHDESASPASDGGTASAAPTVAASVGAAAAAAGVTFGSGFEGAISMHLTTPHGGEDATFLTKGGKIRVDVPGHNGESAHVVFDPGTNKMLVIMDAQKMYMEMDRPPGAVMPGRPPPPAPQITKTGKHETIAGTDCEDWDVAEQNGKHDALCVAQGLSFFDFTSMGPRASASGWMDELKAQKFFPLRAVDTDATGKETSRMEVTKIEKKPVDDSVFAPPAGYHTMSIPRFGGGGAPGLPPH